MQLYDCKVRLKGSLYNEVHKRGVSAAEIMVLRVIHGGAVDDMDAVVDVKPSMDADGKRLPVSEVDDHDERERLQELYGEALHSIEHISNINGLFGPASALPQVLDGVEPNTVKTRKPPKRTRVPKPTAAEAAAASLM